MTHVVPEATIRCKYTDCVDVCPVDCFREGPNFLSIDPDECIDCAVCIPECPVNAIVPEEDVPGDQQHFIKLERRGLAKWPSITKRRARCRRRPVEGPHRQARPVDQVNMEPHVERRSGAHRRVPTSGPIETDAVIVGAGPVGLFQVFELGLLEIRRASTRCPTRRQRKCIELSRQADLRHPGRAGAPARN